MPDESRGTPQRRQDRADELPLQRAAGQDHHRRLHREGRLGCQHSLRGNSFGRLTQSKENYECCPLGLGSNPGSDNVYVYVVAVVIRNLVAAHQHSI